MKFSIVTFLLFCCSNVFCQLCGELEWINVNNNIRGIINSIEIQQDGKIIAVGTEYYGSAYRFIAVSRYSSSGILDTSFSSDGIQITNINNNCSGNSSAIQNDGKIIVGGIARNGTYIDLALVRYNLNGSLDSTFSLDGIVTMNIDSTSNLGGYIALQQDGKIVVTGYTYSIPCKFIVGRYNTGGTIDSAFSSDGIVTTVPDSSSGGKVTSIAIQQDGKIIITGSLQNDIILVRYNTDGTFDNSFSSDGIVITDINSAIDNAKAIAIQNDGKILLTGTSDDKFILIRYNTDGSLDSTFSINGFFSTPTVNFITPNTLAIQKDEKIIVAGSHLNGSMKDFAFVRINVDGTIDSSLYYDGIVTTPLNWSSGAICVAIQQDGKIILGGNSSSNVEYFTLTRYTCDDVSVQTANLNMGFTIFPNPANESLNVKIENAYLSQIHITFYNYQGQLIKCLILNNNESTIDIHELPPGIYVIKIAGEKTNYSDKFIKLY